MAEISSEVSSVQLPTDNITEPHNLEVISLPSKLPENSEDESFIETKTVAIEEELIIADKQESSVQEKGEVNILDDIVQLIELVGNCVTKDGTSGKTKYKDGFIYLENLQTLFESLQEEVSEKDKMIVALVVENSTLKGEVVTSKDQLSRKCQELQKLEKNYNNLQNEINKQKIKEKPEVYHVTPIEILKSKANQLQQSFNKLKSKIGRQAATKADLSSVQQATDIKTFQDGVEASLGKLGHNMLLLAKCQKKIEEQLEYTQTSLEKLNEMCSESTKISTAIPDSQSTSQSQQQINLELNTTQAMLTKITEKHKSPNSSMPQVQPPSFPGFNLNSVVVPTLPYFKPFSNTNDQSQKSSQQPKQRAVENPKHLISDRISSFVLQQKPQLKSKSFVMGHHNNLLNQHFPNLIPQAKNKCSICGMSFFTGVQLKLHEDLVHNHTTSGPAEVTISSSLPYTPYTQVPPVQNASPLQPLQKHYHKHLWSSSQSTKQSKMSRNTSLSGVNTPKRHCIGLSLNSSYPPVSIPSSIVNSFKHN